MIKPSLSGGHTSFDVKSQFTEGLLDDALFIRGSNGSKLSKWGSVKNAVDRFDSLHQLRIHRTAHRPQV